MRSRRARVGRSLDSRTSLGPKNFLRDTLKAARAFFGRSVVEAL